MLASQIEGRGEAWLGTAIPSNRLVTLGVTPGLSRGCSEQFVRKPVRGKAQGFSDALAKLVTGMGICEQVSHSISSLVSLCIVFLPFAAVL